MKTRILPLTITVMATLGLAGQAQTFTDIGATPPTPGPNDVYMTDESNVQQVPGLNYYSNGGNGAPVCPGEIFTTGSYAGGYVLSSLAVLAGGNGGGGITTTPQTWYLRLWSYNAANSNATLLATYASQPFTFYEGDWLQFTGLSLGLSPNTTYAFSIQNGGSGWEMIGAEDTGNTTVNQAVLIPNAGGMVQFSSAAPAWQADFDVGLVLNTSLTVNPPAFVTPGNVYQTAASAYTANTPITIDCGAVLGTGTLTYQWQTDGGTGGVLTNIPGSTATNIVVTAAALPGSFRYDVVVGNGAMFVTSSIAQFFTAFPNVGAALVDEGSNYVTTSYFPTISQLSVYGSAGSGDGLNYYDNNPAHSGQTFTTGTNAQGYILTSVQLQSDPFSNQGGSEAPQPFYLYIYSINTNGVAQIIQAYTNATGQVTAGDWIEWSGLHVAMASNSVYAYTFANDPSEFSYFGLYASMTNDYQGGQLCLIDPVNGSVTYDGTDPATNNSAVFYLQFQPIGVPIPFATASPILVSPASGAPGTQFTLSVTASGATPLGYFWFTDGGSGGTMTNIPGNDVSNLLVNTVGWQPGVYSYQVIVSNSLNTATSSVASVPLLLPSTSGTGVLTDLGGNAPTPGANDIDQLNGVVGYQASEPAGLNYYIDNSQPPGETFTTGNNPNGYVLTSAAVQLGLDDAYAGWPANGQGYFLNIYRVYNDQGGEYAQLYQSITSQTNFVLTVGVSEGHWLQMTGFSLPLAPNTVYAYAFGKIPGDAGYINLVAANNTPAYYTGGQAALLPATSGKIQFSSASGWNATFDLGLALGTAPATLSLKRGAGGQLQLQWSGGILEQAPSVTGPWTTNNATSPYNVTPSAPRQFYRVLQQ